MVSPLADLIADTLADAQDIGRKATYYAHREGGIAWMVDEPDFRSGFVGPPAAAFGNEESDEECDLYTANVRAVLAALDAAGYDTQ